MKTQRGFRWPVLSLAVSLLALAAPARADFAVVNYNGDHLVRRAYTLSPMQHLTVATAGCNSVDTVMFLLQGTVDTDGTKTTVAFNDDYNDDLCSQIDFVNLTNSTRDYTLLVVPYTLGSAGNVTLSDNLGRSEVVWVGGVSWRFGGDGSHETIQTVPVRGANGGHAMDTVLYVIDPTINGTVHYDDDSGMQLLSKMTNLNCSNKTCWMVAGNYWLDGGGPISVWSQNVSGHDADGDGISDSLEQLFISYGMLPAGADRNKDSDGDGLSDYVELVGVPATTGLAGFDNSLCMPWQGPIGGPDPKVQDLFIEVDYMQQTSGLPTDHSDAPYAGLAADLTSIFSGDSAWTSRNIRTHFELSQNIGHWAGISFSNCTGTGQLNFYTIKNNSNYFDPLRRLVYHYVIAAHGLLGSNCASVGNGGQAEILGNDVMITLSNGGGVSDIRGMNVHELGHNLFLDHNSNDDSGGAYSCAHSSVMNYRYTKSGWGNAGNALRAFGYSRGACPSGNTGGVCTNTCTGHCVLSGQVTPKLACPVATSGTNKGKHVSNGTCDCDRDEWVDPGAAPMANHVSLAFQNDSDASTGPGADVASQEALAEYVQGGLGEQHKMTALHQQISDRKVNFLRSQGLVEGKQFWRSPENGKLYSVE